MKMLPAYAEGISKSDIKKRAIRPLQINVGYRRSWPLGPSSPNRLKDREKQDQLSDMLNGYSVDGLPAPPSLMRIGQNLVDEQLFILEDDWRLIVQDSQNLTKRQHDQQEAIWELLQTELHYIHSLRVITDLFLCVLLNIQNELLLNEIETEKLFVNIGEIGNANCEFWQKHLVCVVQTSRSSNLPFNPSLMKEGFTRYHEIFQPYIGYCSKQRTCLDYSKTQYTENDLFKTFVVWAEAQKQCNRLKLTDLLVKPMQRLTKYSLLLQAILRKTDDEEQRKDLLEMISSVDRFVHHVNSTLRQQHEEEKLQAIVDKVEAYDAVEAPNDECLKIIQPYNGNFNLTAPMPGCDITQTRSLVMQSALKLKDYQSRMDVECLLFTDLLLVCKASKRMDKYKIVKPPMRVDRIIVHELKDKGSFLLIYVNEYHVPVSSFTFHADQMGIRVWVDHIRKAQDLYREARLAATTGERKQVFQNSETVEEEVIGYTPLVMPDNPPMLHLTRCSSDDGSMHNHLDNATESGSPINRSRSWNEMESSKISGPVRQNAITSDPRLERKPAENRPPLVQYSNSEPAYGADRDRDRDTYPSDLHLQVPSMRPQPVRADSEGHLLELVEEGMKSKHYQRRTSRTEKRYYTADAIQELQKNENRDTSIYKRLSWNFGNGDLSTDKQGQLRHKTMSTDSLRSIHSSSGVSSTGSLHLSPEGDICEEIVELPRERMGKDNHKNNAIPLDVNEDDLEDGLYPDSRQSKSKSTSDICTLMHELSTNDIKDGISSVELPKMDESKRKLSHAQILRMKKQLLLSSSNIEASEV